MMSEIYLKRGRFRGGNGKPLRYSYLKNPMDRGAWWNQRVTKSWTWLNRAEQRYSWCCFQIMYIKIVCILNILCTIKIINKGEESRAEVQDWSWVGLGNNRCMGLIILSSVLIYIYIYIYIMLCSLILSQFSLKFTCKLLSVASLIA